jgi:hypothetical protein
MYRTGDNERFGDGQPYYERCIEGDTQTKLNRICIDMDGVESAILQASRGVLASAIVPARCNPDFLVGHVEFEP